MPQKLLPHQLRLPRCVVAQRLLAAATIRDRLREQFLLVDVDEEYIAQDDGRLTVTIFSRANRARLWVTWDLDPGQWERIQPAGGASKKRRKRKR